MSWEKLLVGLRTTQAEKYKNIKVRCISYSRTPFHIASESGRFFDVSQTLEKRYFLKQFSILNPWDSSVLTKSAYKNILILANVKFLGRAGRGQQMSRNYRFFKNRHQATFFATPLIPSKYLLSLWRVSTWFPRFTKHISTMYMLSVYYVNLNLFKPNNNARSYQT